MTAVIEPAAPVVGTLLAVVDCARYAWDNSYAEELAGLPADFVHDYRVQLDEAAVVAIVPHLITAWARRGREVTFGSYELLESGAGRELPNETYWAVWNEAADELDPYDLVDAAELNDELNGYMEVDS